MPGFTLHQILRVHVRLSVVPALELVAEVADALEAGWSQVGPTEAMPRPHQPVGTTDYMAPERAKGAPLQRAGQPLADTPSGNVFSLRIMLFVAFTEAFYGVCRMSPRAGRCSNRTWRRSCART